MFILNVSEDPGAARGILSVSENSEKTAEIQAEKTCH
jgi:hypothetical protein